MSIDYDAMTVTRDIDDLGAELIAVLGGDKQGEVPIADLLKKTGHGEQLQDVRLRLQHYLQEARSFLTHLYKPETPSGKVGDTPYAEFAKTTLFAALSDLGQCEAVLDRLSNLINAMTLRGVIGGVTTNIPQWLSTMIGWIKGICRQLWTMLAGLVKPKEWTLGGKVGTGPFNLTDVTVEITFGP